MKHFSQVQPSEFSLHALQASAHCSGIDLLLERLESSRSDLNSENRFLRDTLELLSTHRSLISLQLTYRSQLIGHNFSHVHFSMQSPLAPASPLPCTQIPRPLTTRCPLLNVALGIEFRLASRICLTPLCSYTLDHQELDKILQQTQSSSSLLERWCHQRARRLLAANITDVSTATRPALTARPPHSFNCIPSDFTPGITATVIEKVQPPLFWPGILNAWQLEAYFQRWTPQEQHDELDVFCIFNAKQPKYSMLNDAEMLTAARRVVESQFMIGASL